MANLSTDIARLMLPMPRIADLLGAEARIILALRLAIISGGTGRNCRKRLCDHLGNDHAVDRFLILLEVVGNSWPESVKIGRPCCPQLTPDEMCILSLIRRAAGSDRLGFDMLLCEMIGPCERDRIFDSVGIFVSAYASD